MARCLGQSLDAKHGQASLAEKSSQLDHLPRDIPNCHLLYSAKCDLPSFLLILSTKNLESFIGRKIQIQIFLVPRSAVTTENILSNS